MPATPRPLALLHRHSTRWEVAIYDDGKAVEAVAFTARRTRSCLLNLAHDNRAALLAMMSESDLNQQWRYDSRLGRIHFGARASIGFSGATEYQRASEAALAA